MNVFPELYTNRLRLRKIEVTDVPSLVKYANNKKISDHILNIPYPYDEPDAVFRIAYVVQGFKNKSRYVFSIILEAEQTMIGEISLHLVSKNNNAQLGYWIGEPFWGKGITTEAVAAVLKFGFEKLGLERIFANCHEDNIASCKILLRNRMKKDHTTGSIQEYSVLREAMNI